jgi:sterol desaturase/sphingolipid hydroxylase (fatty acid hydroxylase superfamily)
VKGADRLLPVVHGDSRTVVFHTDHQFALDNPVERHLAVLRSAGSRGLSTALVGGVLAANLFYQFWLHAAWLPRLAPLEWILNTAGHHRVHHASNPEYLDVNFGGVLIVFDRLFDVTTRSLVTARLWRRDPRFHDTCFQCVGGDGATAA